MLIDNKIIFDESKTLSNQNREFLDWYYKNVSVLINSTLIPDSLDEFNRPVSYTVSFESYKITISYIYKLNIKSSWECTDYNIIIK